jgi:hypothetical protein
MSETPEHAHDFVREKVEAIVADGQNVRAQVSQLVTESADRFQLNREGLIGLTQSVLDATATAVDKVVPHDPASVLRQVVDGLGDGLSAAALASRLAVEEAEAQRKSFADEDLSKLNKDLKAIGNLFVDTVFTAAKKARSVTATQLTTLRDHATTTVKRIQPSLESAISAVQKHPLQFAKESVGAGLAMSRQAVGTLFGAVGRTLQKAGQVITGDKPGEKKLSPAASESAAPPGGGEKSS